MSVGVLMPYKPIQVVVYDSKWIFVVLRRKFKEIQARIVLLWSLLFFGFLEKFKENYYHILIVMPDNQKPFFIRHGLVHWKKNWIFF